MSPESVLFIVIAIITLGSAFMVVTVRSLIHMALWLIVTLFGVAILFGILSAGFLAIVQVVIYIGAIAILLIFAIMLTRQVAREGEASYNQNWRWALFIALLLFAGLLGILTSWTGVSATAPEMDARANPIVDLGKALVDPGGFLLPFEVVSVLLLAALIGAVFVAMDRRRA